ncbi:NUDIX hydrolase [Rhizobium hainanense]|uniref:ADP-ribose pyrophosphatase YjhB, NUDIX family n=1 Tax=Rhizobium hainanense TaxID=52131 RepID=A0A1C3U970_9HYPH|nr:NUDIX hydrolase [Rhizobium hainanense]SCB12034.1 ADP-ribose pyrophosphatase YjhB, NUDIX family [Rhizobium hainanense]
MTTIVLAAFIESGRVLMARRAANKQHYPGHWDLVGGHVEADEPIVATLIREAREEVGVTPVIFRYLGFFKDSRYETTYHLYEVTGWSDGLPRLIGDEHTDLAWVALDGASLVAPLAHPEVMSFLSPD